MNDGTVHIVDDDRAVRDSLKLLIRSIGLDTREYGSGRQFLDRYAPSKPECLLLDLHMPGVDGLELQRELSRRGVSLAVVFLSGHGDIPVAMQAMRGGAIDFVEKPFKEEQLLERIRKAVAIDADREKTRTEREEARKRLSTLTPRERQVVDLIAKGKINKVVAADLSLSVRTVESHRARAINKLGAGSLSDLFNLVRAAEQGDPEEPDSANSHENE